MAETVMRVAAGESWALRCSKREEEGGGTSRRRRHFFAKIGSSALWLNPSLSTDYVLRTRPCALPLCVAVCLLPISIASSDSRRAQLSPELRARAANTNPKLRQS